VRKCIIFYDPRDTNKIITNIRILTEKQIALAEMFGIPEMFEIIPFKELIPLIKLIDEALPLYIIGSAEVVHNKEFLYNFILNNGIDKNRIVDCSVYCHTTSGFFRHGASKQKKTNKKK